MTPPRGWGQTGARLPGHSPHGHWRRMTFAGALRVGRTDAPCVFDGPINGDLFRAHVEQVLVPTLHPGDVVVMELGSHRGSAVRKAIRAAGAPLLCLPPCSPDLKPIEQVVAKPKHLMRTASERTVEAVWKRLGSRLDSFPAEECANHLRNAGYASD